MMALHPLEMAVTGRTRTGLTGTARVLLRQPRHVATCGSRTLPVARTLLSDFGDQR